MPSDSPGTPGRRQQMPRTTRSIRAPAADAAYSSSINLASTIEFIFIVMRAARMRLPADQRLQRRAEVHGRDDAAGRSRLRGCTR